MASKIQAMDEPQEKGLQAFLNGSQSNQDDFLDFLSTKNSAQKLEFVWAVQGIKNECYRPSTLENLIRGIDSTLLNEIGVSEKVRKSVQNRIASGDYGEDIFDQAFAEVWNVLESVWFKVFLMGIDHEQRPEIYSPIIFSKNSELLQNQTSQKSQQWNNFDAEEQSNNITEAISDQQSEQFQQPENSQDDEEEDQEPTQQKYAENSFAPQQGSQISSVQKIQNSNNLQTIFADRELILKNRPGSVVSSNSDGLHQNSCCSFDSKSGRQDPTFPYYINNISQNPLSSRRDFEVQSISSDSEANSEIRHSHRSCNKKGGLNNLLGSPGAGKLRRINCIVRPDAETHFKKFANQLTEKLQEVLLKRERDQQNNNKRIDCPALAINSEANNPKISNRVLQQEGTPPEEILDQHFSRVWSDASTDSLASPYTSREWKRVKIPRLRAYDQDSGISVTTTSTSSFDKRLHSWINSAAKPITKISRKEISCLAYYGNQDVPFSFKIPPTTGVTAAATTANHAILLGKFKEFVPIRGNFRYFFKCTDSDIVVLKELTREDEEIPLFENKIVAKLQEVKVVKH